MMSLTAHDHSTITFQSGRPHNFSPAGHPRFFDFFDYFRLADSLVRSAPPKSSPSVMDENDASVDILSKASNVQVRLQGCANAGFASTCGRRAAPAR
jgi:hypothetical protein